MSFDDRLVSLAAPIRDAVRAALENGTPLRISGARGWLDAGRPVSASDDLAVTAAGVVEYVPGDLTITVRAGTTLADIAATTAEHRQWLPLDPFGSPGGTIGATVATGSAGPLAHAFGTPRDQVIGLGFVSGRGDYVRGGGRVVKNVAGFDIARVVIGSWGTLGIVTDVTLRLRALPETELTVALVLSEEGGPFRAALQALGEAHLAPLALEVLNAATARAIGEEENTLLLARLGGNQPLVAAQRAALAALGEVREVHADVWERLRTLEPPGSSVVRYSGALVDFPALWRRLDRHLTPAGGLIHGTPARGIVRCIVPAAALEYVLHDLPQPEPRTTRIFERLRADLWPELAPAAVNHRLAQRVRQAFDPGMLLNPGILGEQTA